MITLPAPTDIRTLTNDDKAQPRRVVMYRTHPSQAAHLAILEPYAVICRRHRHHTDPVIVENTATGESLHAALLTIADQLLEANTDPRWLCPDCAGTLKWWLGESA